MKTEYRIIYAMSLRDVEDVVNRLIAGGWLLAGGVSIAVTPGYGTAGPVVFAQAVTRTTEA